MCLNRTCIFMQCILYHPLLSMTEPYVLRRLCQFDSMLFIYVRQFSMRQETGLRVTVASPYDAEL